MVESGAALSQNGLLCMNWKPVELQKHGLHRWQDPRPQSQIVFTLLRPAVCFHHVLQIQLVNLQSLQGDLSISNIVHDTFESNTSTDLPLQNMECQNVDNSAKVPGYDNTDDIELQVFSPALTIIPDKAPRIIEPNLPLDFPQSPQVSPFEEEPSTSVSPPETESQVCNDQSFL